MCVVDKVYFNLLQLGMKKTQLALKLQQYYMLKPIFIAGGDKCLTLQFTVWEPHQSLRETRLVRAIKGLHDRTSTYNIYVSRVNIEC